MMPSNPEQIWWTADEIAAAVLPDMPTTKRRVNALSGRQNWRGQTEFARKRAGRGGGWEYHWSLFPAKAQQVLIARCVSTPEVLEPASRDEAWAAYEKLPETCQASALERLNAIQSVEALIAAGTARRVAIRNIADHNDVSERTIWNWFALIHNVREEDRLAYLAPKHRAAARKVNVAECDPLFMGVLKADFLRLECPSFSSCYRRSVKIAKKQGFDFLIEQTARRRLNAEVPKSAQIYARKGLEALKRLYPAQTRDKRALHPLEAVNADYHKWDVFVAWPNGAGGVDIVRPQMCAFQDIYSGRVLSWRLDRTPNKVSVGLCLGDMIEQFGIPEHMLLDNGREFANKFLTGQAETRHRFRIRDDDIQGLLVTLGVKIHWATPYSGQSKPIERAFRDMCDDIAKDPRFAGAYTGNRPDAKPENYGSKAIPLEEFQKVIGEGIEEHNTRVGRRSITARGRSFVETFDAAYVTAPIRKATEAQRRLWLMGAEGLRGDSSTGLVRFQGNEYWSAWMHSLCGKKIIARFDPADLFAGLHIYALSGGYLGHAECKVKAGFFDIDEARSHARARRAFVNAEREVLKAAQTLRLSEVNRYLDDAAPEPTAPVVASVVRPIFRPAKPTPSAVPEAEKEAHDAFVADFSSAQKKRQPKAEKDEALERFMRAMELERRLDADEPVTPDQQRWLDRYQRQPEYQAHQAIWQVHGDDMFG